MTFPLEQQKQTKNPALEEVENERIAALVKR
jgi:hypothetical protein